MAQPNQQPDSQHNRPRFCYNPPGARIRPRDRFDADIVNQIGGSENIHEQARDLLLSNFTTNELLDRRLVSREWRDAINQRFGRVASVKIFYDRVDASRYNDFATKCSMGGTCFELNEADSLCQVVLLCDDLDRLIGILPRFLHARNLILFMDPPTRLPAIEWLPRLGRILEAMPAVNDLFLYRYGINGWDGTMNEILHYKQLRRVHLVQPTRDVWDFLVAQQNAAALKFGGSDNIQDTILSALRWLSRNAKSKNPSQPPYAIDERLCLFWQVTSDSNPQIQRVHLVAERFSVFENLAPANFILVYYYRTEVHSADAIPAGARAARNVRRWAPN